MRKKDVAIVGEDTFLVFKAENSNLGIYCDEGKYVLGDVTQGCSIEDILPYFQDGEGSKEELIKKAEELGVDVKYYDFRIWNRFTRTE